MKKLVIIALAFTTLFSPIHVQAAVELKSEEVEYIQVSRESGGSRIFKESDGFEEVIIRKVIDLINAATPIKGQINLAINKPLSTVIKIKMKSGEVALIEPAYNCIFHNETKTCTLADDEVILNQNNKNIRLKSTELFDWLLIGWKYESVEPPKDTKELMVNDILMLLLGEEIEKAVSDYYSKYLTEPPLVYPYQVDIVNVKRIGGFRTFHFLITLETTPVVGPHISVGKDRLTFEIDPTIPGQIKLIKFEHLETHALPPHWQNIIKQNKNQ
ncbi:DUF3888 domain-containing protein [Neobacillus niacini]|uniref:DUF3888 domain-containing protein n=1 Tax=Neobacillus niacini TaxID=86668 RepID=UPI0006931CAA|nr:DUF3888 domain-containing protein [Neobacillus niacini]